VDIVEIGLLALAVVLVIGGGGVAIDLARPRGLTKNVSMPYRMPDPEMRPRSSKLVIEGEAEI
jgi:hypothetical protein